jgi:hypothetical protein
MFFSIVGGYYYPWTFRTCCTTRRFIPQGKVASAQFVVDFIRASTQVEEVGKQRLGALLHVVVPLLPGGLDENAGDFEEPIFQ